MRFLLSGLLVLLGLLSVSFQENPFDLQQRVLSEKLTSSWDSIWNDCNTFVRRPIRDKSDAQRYLQCMFGNLPTYIRTWASLNTTVLEEAREQLQNIFRQNMPEGESDSKQRIVLANVAGFAHKKYAAWHRRFAGMIVELGNAGFLNRSEVGDLTRVIQESMNDATGAARAFIAAVQAEGVQSHEALVRHVDAYHSKLESSTQRVVGICQTNLLNAVIFADRQYPTFLGRNIPDYNEFAEGYDEFFNNIFMALNRCASELWDQPEQPSS